MTKNEFLQKLKSCVSAEECEALRNQDSDLIIGKYNRDILNQMLLMSHAGEDIVDDQKIEQLKELLQDYLNQYMEQKAGHKWVILASLFNTFVLEVPMHPIEVTKIKIGYENGKKVYFCPCKEEEEGSVCNFCVCDTV